MELARLSKIPVKELNHHRPHGKTCLGSEMLELLQELACIKVTGMLTNKVNRKLDALQNVVKCIRVVHNSHWII